MRGVLLAVLTFALSSGVAAGVDMRIEHENTAASCPGLSETFDVGRALRNSTLYEQVYVWMRERDVEDWNYSTAVRMNGSTAMECATVTYSSYIDSPTFVAQMLRNLRMEMHFPIAVRKEVCVAGQTVVETANVTVPLLHGLTMTSRYDVSAESVHTLVDAHYDVPWYADFLVSDIEQHVEHSFKRKAESVAHSLCAPRPPAKLGEPAQKFKLHAFRRAAGKHPLHTLPLPKQEFKLHVHPLQMPLQRATAPR